MLKNPDFSVHKKASYNKQQNKVHYNSNCNCRPQKKQAGNISSFAHDSIWVRFAN